MTRILVLLMFAIFIGIDYLRSRHAVKEMVAEPIWAATPSNVHAGEYVEGLAPSNVRYHPGHGGQPRDA